MILRIGRTGGIALVLFSHRQTAPDGSGLHRSGGKAQGLAQQLLGFSGALLAQAHIGQALVDSGRLGRHTLGALQSDGGAVEIAGLHLTLGSGQGSLQGRDVAAIGQLTTGLGHAGRCRLRRRQG